MQVLFNLLSNAQQALARLEPSRSYRACGRARPKTQGRRWVVVDIVDDGPGVPEAFIDRIFEPFFTTRDDGTGYGLYLAAELLKEQSGRLTVRNNREGGATFTIWLPRAGFGCRTDGDRGEVDVGANEAGRRGRDLPSSQCVVALAWTGCGSVRMTLERSRSCRSRSPALTARVGPLAGRPLFSSALAWLVVVALAVAKLRQADGIIVALAALAASAVTFAITAWADRVRWRNPIEECDAVCPRL